MKTWLVTGCSSGLGRGIVGTILRGKMPFRLLLGTQSAILTFNRHRRNLFAQDAEIMGWLFNR